MDIAHVDWLRTKILNACAKNLENKKVANAIVVYMLKQRSDVLFLMTVT